MFPTQKIPIEYLEMFLCFIDMIIPARVCRQVWVSCAKLEMCSVYIQTMLQMYGLGWSLFVTLSIGIYARARAALSDC